MTWLSDWSEAIARIGEDSARKEAEYLDRMEAQMPQEIATLPAHGDDYLLDLMVEFSGQRMNPRENEIRGKFLAAVRAEILSRMVKA